MRSANLFGPLKGLCPHKALIGLTQASGLAGGFDLSEQLVQFFLERPFLCVGQGIKLPEIMLDVLHTLIKAEDIG